MMDAVKSKDIMKRMAEFDRLRTNDPVFKFFRQDMSILDMMKFIRALYKATWSLYLQALEISTK